MSYSRVERLERPSLEALDRDILLVPEPEPHDVQHVGGGPPLLLPRCSAARAGCPLARRARHHAPSGFEFGTANF